MKEFGASLVSWVIGLIASGEAAILIRKMVEAAKARAGAQGISEDGHKTTHDKLDALQDLLSQGLSVAQAEAASAKSEADALRAERDALQKTVERQAAQIKTLRGLVQPAEKKV